MAYTIINSYLNRAVPCIFTTLCGSLDYPYFPLTRSLETLKRRGLSEKPNLKESFELNWNFKRTGVGSNTKSVPWGRGRYKYIFKEQHIPIDFRVYTT